MDLMNVTYSSNQKAKARSQRSRRLLWITMAIIAFMQFFPLLWVFNFSLMPDRDVFTSGLLVWPAHPKWDNYSMALINGRILQYALNSVLIVSITIIITLLISLMLGYAITRMKWKLSGAVLSFVLIGIMIPIHTTLLPNFLIYQKIDILDKPWALIIPYTAFSIPLGVYIITGFMSSVPVALEESALIDGCSIGRIIFQIVMPITKPALVTIVVMTFINNWNEFIMAATFLSSTKWKTLPFSVYEFAGQYTSRYAVQFAVMVLSALPSLIVYIIFNEQITKGVTFGAVKG
jgi:raffinose/stachyose/melibiose transport system permease protein